MSGDVGSVREPFRTLPACQGRVGTATASLRSDSSRCRVSARLSASRWLAKITASAMLFRPAQPIYTSQQNNGLFPFAQGMPPALQQDTVNSVFLTSFPRFHENWPPTLRARDCQLAEGRACSRRLHARTFLARGLSEREGCRRRARVPGPLRDPPRLGARPHGSARPFRKSSVPGLSPATRRSTPLGCSRNWKGAARRRRSRQGGTGRTHGSMTGTCTAGGTWWRTSPQMSMSSGRSRRVTTRHNKTDGRFAAGIHLAAGVVLEK